MNDNAVVLALSKKMIKVEEVDKISLEICMHP
jgi:hypothetical protein